MNPPIASANGLTRGQESAVLIKIAQQMGILNIEHAVKLFLQGNCEVSWNRFIEFCHCTRTVAPSDGFVLKDMFKLKKDGGTFSHIDERFSALFLSSNVLCRNSSEHLFYGNFRAHTSHKLLIEEIGGYERVESGLSDIALLLPENVKGQFQEHDNVLLEDEYGSPNMFYVKDLNGTLHAIRLHVSASSLGHALFIDLVDGYKIMGSGRVFWSKNEDGLFSA